MIWSAASRMVRPSSSIRQVGRFSFSPVPLIAATRSPCQAGLDAGVEVCLFVGPRERFGTGATPRSADGRAHGIKCGACANATEKVHRAAVALEWLERLSPGLVQSKPGAAGLGLPVR